MHYGGMDGVWERRKFNPDDAFEAAVNRALGKQICKSEKFAAFMWGALANIDWEHESGDTAGYSFRAAGDLIAAIRGEGMYMDWYCSAPVGVVSKEIADAMAKEGWKYRIYNASTGNLVQNKEKESDNA
jgi:hypothetical protein